jgi:hypothetical protein
MTAEERVRAVTHDMFELLLVHAIDAIRVAEQHAAAAVAEVTSERDEARAEVEKCAATGWYGLVEYERRRANEANAAVRGLAEERTRAVVRAERVERERDEARAEVEKLRVLRAQAEPFVPATMLAVRKAFALGELRHEHNVQIVLDTQMRAMVVELRAALKAADGGEVL